MSLKAEITKTREGKFIWHQERTIIETTELLCELLAAAHVTRAQLAEKLGKSKGLVSQLLDGSANMTLRTISDVCLALGYQFHPSVSAIGGKRLATLTLDNVPTDWTELPTVGISTLQSELSRMAAIPSA